MNTKKVEIVGGHATEREAQAVEKLVGELAAMSRARAAGATGEADTWARTAEQFGPLTGGISGIGGRTPQYNPSAFRNIRYY